MAGECHSKAPPRKRPFLISAYGIAEDGTIDVELPHQAPCGADGCPCRIGKHSERERKTGIDHVLVVIRCKTHKQCWTLYPPGFAPFLRRPIWAEAGWLATVFWAAFAAADAHTRAWARCRKAEPSNPGLHWRTQLRHIQRAALLLGLVDSDDEPAQLLGVPIHHAHEAIEAFGQAGGFRARGWAIVSLLAHAEPHDWTRVLSRLGARARLWGEPWVVREGVLHPL